MKKFIGSAWGKVIIIAVVVIAAFAIRMVLEQQEEKQLEILPAEE